MLVLSRKVGEKVVIAGDISVTITRVAGGRVTLGIQAPEHVRVVRGELRTHGSATPSETSESTGRDASAVSATGAPPSTMLGLPADASQILTTVS